MLLVCLFFKVNFVLKIICNLCLFALSWFEIKHKTRHCPGENLSRFLIKCVRKKLLKGNEWTCTWEKMNPQDAKY